MQNANCKLQNSDAVVTQSHDSDSANRKPTTPDAMCDRILDFADRVSTVVEALPDTKLGNRIANQLLRSGTSPIGNYEEACAAESKDDFVHKLRICLKEVREPRGWLRLTSRRKLVSPTRLAELIDESEQLAKMLGQSIATVRGVPKKTTTIRTTTLK
jgi:four helix bundle protein